MCNNKTLSHCDGGYVFQCSTCGLYQLAYGTSLLSFSAADFNAFRQQVRDRLARQPQDFPNHKCIALDLMAPNCYMILCYKELEELSELLNEAWFASELQSLVGSLGNRGRG